MILHLFLSLFLSPIGSACGSTIGPIIATSLGVRTVDVGIAQFSMHSIREMCGSDDVESAITLFTALFKDYEKLNNSLGGAI
jgi:aspartyl aminopeptidase